MSNVIQDVRYALRGFARRPGFTLVVVLTLALGIGANTAIFTLVRAVLLRPLPYQDPDNLVVLWSRFPGLREEGLLLDSMFNDEEGVLSPAMYFRIKDQTKVFTNVAIAATSSFTLTEGDIPERVQGVRASVSCLAMLGAKPVLGRMFAPGDDEPGSPPTIVLSHALWQHRFGGDPGVIGRPLRLSDQSYTVIGVLEQGFPASRAYLPMFRDPAARVDYWVPLVLNATDRDEHGRQNYRVLARLAHGATIASAREEMRLLAGRVAQEAPNYYPPRSDFTLDVLPLPDLVVQAVRPALWLLTGASGLVLLIACANVANLLLAQAAKRHREIGMRMALGASRLRIARQLLTESVLLSLLGGVAGLLVGWWSTSLLLTIGAERIPRINEADLDVAVVAFAFGLSVLTGIIFGLVPAWNVSLKEPDQFLRAAARSLTGAVSFWRWRCNSSRLLVVGELSLSTVLLVGAGLLLHSFYKLQCVYPGFSYDNLLTCQLPANPNYRKDMAAYANFYDQLGERLAALPGVESVGGVNVLPMMPGDCTGPVVIEGDVPPKDEACLTAEERVVLWNYFGAMRIPLVAGRYFNTHDTSPSLPVVIVDETFAKRFWPAETAVGKHIKAPWLGPRAPWVTVVGVVGAVRHSDLESPARITYYRPYAQRAQQAMCLTVRTSADPLALADPVANAVWALDPDRPLIRVATMEQRMSDVLARRRFSLALLVVFAGLALVLAAVGLYAVLSQVVSQSTHEIGVRMALGAQRSVVLRAVLAHSLMLTAVGLAIGLAVSMAATRVLASMLYGVGMTDPATFVAVPVLLTVVAVLACYLPARRAARVDPLVALRCEQ